VPSFGPIINSLRWETTKLFFLNSPDLLLESRGKMEDYLLHLEGDILTTKRQLPILGVSLFAFAGPCALLVCKEGWLGHPPLDLFFGLAVPCLLSYLTLRVATRHLRARAIRGDLQSKTFLLLSSGAQECLFWYYVSKGWGGKALLCDMRHLRHTRPGQAFNVIHRYVPDRTMDILLAWFGNDVEAIKAQRLSFLNGNESAVEEYIFSKKLPPPAPVKELAF